MNSLLPNNIKATIAEGANKGREVTITGFDTDADKWKIEWRTGVVGWVKSNELVLQPGYEFSSEDKIVATSTQEKLMPLPEHILKRIRQRHDLDENDSSRDVEFNSMEPARAFEEVVCWELGDGRWAPQLLNWARECGFEIKPN